MIIKTFPVPPLGCNCTILGDPVTKKAIVVDPGGAFEQILTEVRNLGLTIERILHTHAHFDHFLASSAIRKATGALLCLHEADRKLWDMLDLQCELFGVVSAPAVKPEHFLKDEEQVGIGGFKGVALHTPGHTPGSMSFYFQSQQLVLAGDTLFRGAIGRTDLWGGDFKAIERSIKERLYTLDEQTRVITGHGSETVIGFEKDENMYVRA
ncbi:MAG: MBL fold metallo-hydrolase [Nitrospirae bacterium RIFCSPLOWO2_02_FULL_62_14]|nr:MAG: MBL fold metallo-hydrolase [Nitrospirae bacterium RIFCSPLOWO2_02_FULL_62_14]